MDERLINQMQLAALLRDAEQAHAEYERGLGHPDENWPDWYAEYIFRQIDPSLAADTDLIRDGRMPSSEPFLSE